MPILLTFGFRCSDMEDGFNYCLMTSEKYHNTLDRTYYEWLQEASSSHIFESLFDFKSMHNTYLWKHRELNRKFNISTYGA